MIRFDLTYIENMVENMVDIERDHSQHHSRVCNHDCLRIIPK